jgi:deoxyribodipyrimidine photo-lyase
VKKWVPEFETLEYPLPIIDHKYARTRALETYKSGINNQT